MKEEIMNNPTVQALLEVGFSEDYIEKAIENGDVIIEKSKTEEEMNHSEEDEKKNIKNDEEHVEDLRDDIDEDEDDVDDLKDDEKEVSKSFTPDMMKSFGEEISKSILESVTSVMKSIEERLESLEKISKSISQETPSFKSAGLSRSAILEKSIENTRDEEGKVALNIVTQRPLVKQVIEKALQDDEIAKSYGDSVVGYLMCPEADQLGEEFSRYAYDKLNIKFVK